VKMGERKSQQFQRMSVRGAAVITHRWFALVVAIVLLLIVSIYLLPQGEPFVYLRYVLGVPFVLYLPGYSLTKLLFRSRNLEVLERIALSIALSMFLASVAGVALNYSPWGIKLDPVVVTLSIITIAFSAVAKLPRLRFS
jgi:uncharacterized membrane protein